MRVMSELASYANVLSALSEPAGVFDLDCRLFHETRSLERLLRQEPEASRIRSAMAGAADVISAVRTPFVIGAPITVATRRSTYHLHPSRLPEGLVDPEPALLVLVHRHEARLPDARSLEGRFDLTPRQAEVALLLGRRKTTPEIARALTISPHTARRHTEVVLAKLGVHSRRDVLARILEPGAERRRAS